VTASLDAVVGFLDAHLSTAEVPDYPPALNGLQVANGGQVTRVAAAVDASVRTLAAAAASGADFVVVHHGMFWGGLRPIVGAFRERLRLCLTHDIAVYAAHLPLDAHPDDGNSRLVAAALGLTPTAGFGTFKTIQCGVRGDDTLPTATLLDRARAFARDHGGDAGASPFPADRLTTRWAIVSGSGANAETLREAAVAGVDTLVVGEGPHWTAVDADEQGLAIIYAGHYATETLGVQALARRIADRFGVPWGWIPAPTGL
jgi:dinuclear metal center YbgI/SA1388 family protein